MKTKHLILFLLGIMMLASCASDGPQFPDNSDVTISSNPFEIGKEKAIDIAAKSRQSMFGATRSVPRVQSVDLITSTKTRAGEGDPMYYIINYENESGFAVVSADSRVSPIQAIADEGNLSIADTIQNKGLALFFNLLEDRVCAGLPPIGNYGPGTELDSLASDLVTNETTIRKVEPMLTKFVRNWTQFAPYNSACPFVTIDKLLCRGAVGCLPLSTAQIMSYYKWPEEIENMPLPWNMLSDAYVPTLPYLLAKLGNKDYYKATYTYVYTEDGFKLLTIASDGRIFPVFEMLGYQKPSKSSFFPLFSMSGFDNGPMLVTSHNVSDYNVGHAWVLDGYIIREGKKCDFVTGESIPYTNYYLHCVWGSGGQGDGYYLWSGDSLKDYYYGADEVDKNLGSSNPRASDLVVYSNFVPQK